MTGQTTGNRPYRLLNRDGTFNVSRDGIRKIEPTDLYHSLLAMPARGFMGLLVGAYLAANLLFASGYLLCGEGALAGVDSGLSVGERFLACFFFSVQTLATIGYGKVNPVGLPA